VTGPVDPRLLFEELLPGQLETWSFPTPSVPASLAVRVLGAGEWSFDLPGGRFRARPGLAPETVVQLSLRERDFEALVVSRLLPRMAALGAEASSPDAPDVALVRGVLSRVAGWDRETVDLLRRQHGSIVAHLRDGEQCRSVALTPGLGEPDFESPRCSVTCNLSDLEAVEQGRESPFDLLYGGRLEISGDAEIAVALAGLFL
jgi:hypothetical protein